MPTSIREQALAGLFAELQAITGLAGLAVTRNDDTDVDSFPTINQVDADSTQRVVDRAAGVTLYAIDVTIEGYATAVPGADVGPTVSELWAKIVAAAAQAAANVAVIDQILDGALDSTIVDEDGVAPHAFLALELEVHFGTAEGDPYAQT